MARGNVETGPITLYNALESIRGKTIKERDEGLRSKLPLCPHYFQSDVYRSAGDFR